MKIFTEHQFFVATTRGLKLLDGSSGYSLTYEDKDGDWMLAGDVPWRYYSEFHFKYCSPKLWFVLVEI